MTHISRRGSIKINRRVLFLCFVLSVTSYILMNVSKQRTEQEGQKLVAVSQGLNIDSTGETLKLIETYKLESAESERSKLVEKEKERLRMAEAEVLEEQRVAKVQAEKETKTKAEAEAKKVEQAKKNRQNNNTKTVVKSEVAPSRGGGRNLGAFQATAYCNCETCCGSWSGGKTASGTMPQAGRTIAVDPNFIPLGSKVSVNGSTYIAEDTGSAIKGRIIDIYHDSHSQALKFGRQNVTVKILD